MGTGERQLQCSEEIQNSEDSSYESDKESEDAESTPTVTAWNAPDSFRPRLDDILLSSMRELVVNRMTLKYFYKCFYVV